MAIERERDDISSWAEGLKRASVLISPVKSCSFEIPPGIMGTVCTCTDHEFPEVLGMSR